MTFRFELVEGWERKPDDVRHLDVCDVAVDSQNRVLLVTRADPGVLVYESSGEFVASWGGDQFSVRPHALTIGRDDTVHVVDELDQTVKVFDRDGALLHVVGVSGAASDTGVDAAASSARALVASIRRSGPPFNRPTKVAFARGGDFYVSDGYGNARVHHFSAGGDLLHSWGEPGDGPGEFRLPHSVCVTSDDRVLVADREADRLQVFDLEGGFLEEWTDVQRPTAVVEGPDALVYVTELGWQVGDWSWRHGTIERDLPGRLAVYERDGTLVHRFTSGAPVWEPGNLAAPHGLAVDADGDVYIAEVTHSYLGHSGLVPPDCHTIQKFRRV
jgi:DNA-binding beta-propeller fold protein YncE